MVQGELTISAEVAQQYLDEQEKNRPIKQSIVNMIVADMENDNFDYDHTFVVFNKEGKFHYGQHVLKAIVERGQEFTVRTITLEENDKSSRGVYNKHSRYNVY
jgi:hypothetical protein